MDEARTLSVLGWIIGGIVGAMFTSMLSLYRLARRVPWNSH